MIYKGLPICRSNQCDIEYPHLSNHDEHVECDGLSTQKLCKKCGLILYKHVPVFIGDKLAHYCETGGEKLHQFYEEAPAKQEHSPALLPLIATESQYGHGFYLGYQCPVHGVKRHTSTLYEKQEEAELALANQTWTTTTV